MAQSAILGSSLAKKYWMAATGLFLCLFLLGHLAGNLQLFIPGEAGKLQFNAYAVFMTTNPAVMVLSYLTYISILFHAVDGLLLTLANRKARPVGYAMYSPSRSSHWTARNMGILGTVILAFIVIHMAMFWWKYKFGEIPLDSAGNKDLHQVVIKAFSADGFGMWYTLGYTLAMLAIAFHLWHGVKSAFSSLGLKTPKVERAIQLAGYSFAVLVPLLFASIPIYIYATHS